MMLLFVVVVGGLVVVTSAKEVIFSQCVCPSFCLFINYCLAFHENFARDVCGHWTRKNGLNFGGHPLLDLDIGIF